MVWIGCLKSIFNFQDFLLLGILIWVVYFLPAFNVWGAVWLFAKMIRGISGLSDWILVGIWRLMRNTLGIALVRWSWTQGRLRTKHPPTHKWGKMAWRSAAQQWDLGNCRFLWLLEQTPGKKIAICYLPTYSLFFNLSAYISRNLEEKKLNFYLILTMCYFLKLHEAGKEIWNSEANSTVPTKLN